MMKAYAIVGGGIAGLTAANALAGDGRQVTVYEQSEHLGGRAATLSQKDYCLNFGPHALYRAGEAHRTFENWKIPLPGGSPVYGARSWLFYGEEPFPFFNNQAGVEQTRLFGPEEKTEAARMLDCFSAAAVRPGETADQLLTRITTSPRVRQFAEALFRLRTYSADLDCLDAAAALRQFSMGAHGVLYLDGGWQTMVDGLAARALSLGVTIHRGQPVSSMDSLDADGIVLAVPPDAMRRITGDALACPPPVRMSCLDLGLRRLAGEAASFALAIDRPLYLSVHSLAARLAPEGAAVVHVAKYLSVSEPHGCSRAELENFADLAIPGWRAQVEASRFLPNMTVVHSAVVPQGRPAADALGRAGIAIAGDWVGPEGMLANTAAASGLRAASLVK